MASAPQPTLPLFYNDLMPLNSRDHANYKLNPPSGLTWLVNQHAVPVTTDEFIQAQRHFHRLKTLIAAAYYGSEIGQKELGWAGEFTHGPYQGCEHTSNKHT